MPTDLRALLAQMTLAEKIGQLNQYTDPGDLTGPEAASQDNAARREHFRTGRVGSMLNVVGAARARALQELALESRLKIPMAFGLDVVHGLRTQFPIPIADAAMWDPERSKLACRLAAKEASAAGVSWTFAPMVDISPDQRWGRVMEGAGEDPYLGSVLAKARVEGFQGEDLSHPETIAACAKHLAGYGFAEAGREYNTVRIDDYTMHNEVLPPFRAAVQAGVATVMNGFHLLGGQPVTANKYLQREWLKEGLGFEGAVVSDWNSIGEMEPHGITSDRAAASLIALRAGCDIDMESSGYHRFLEAAVERGEVDVALVDEAVMRVLRLKERLGLFEDPFRYCDEERERAAMGTEKTLAAARDAAGACCVLLQNRPASQPSGAAKANAAPEPLLPLDPTAALKIAVIGELAAETDSPLGSWRVTAEPGTATSLLEGVAAAVGYRIDPAPERGAVGDERTDYREVQLASTSFDPARLSRGDAEAEVRFARGPALLHPDSHRSFVRRMYLNEEDESGLEEAVALAAWADVVVLGIGEHGFMTGEARSRTDIGLPRLQAVLAKAVLAANANTVAVLFHGRGLAIPELQRSCRAILSAWQPGTQAGHGIADVLFGRREPTGRLPVSFPHVTGQCPLTYRRMATGRPRALPDESVWWSHYEDAPNGALFPFGHGLGYTSFELGEVRLSAKQARRGEGVTATVTVTNTGARDGETVVQLYLRDPSARRARPMRELRGFRRVFAKAGQATEVRFDVTDETLAYWTPEEDWHVEDGTYELRVGLSSEHVGAPAVLEVTGAPLTSV